MNQRLRLVVLTVLVVLSLTSIPAFSYTIANIPTAGSYTYLNSGSYLGTVIGENDSITVVEGVLRQLNYNVHITSSSKVDAPNTSSLAGSDFTLYITYADGNKSGTWATFPSPAPSSGVALVDYYVVKGAHEFALYLVNPAMPQGTWNVENLRTHSGNIPAISHFSAYDPVPTPVPIPPTLLLFAPGLAGLALLRKRLKK
jgi:hypothetical protein